MEGFSRQSVRRDMVRVKFVSIERHVPNVGPASDFIHIGDKSVKRLLLADLRDDMVWQRVESSAKR